MSRLQKRQKTNSVMIVCEGAAEKNLWKWLKRSLRHEPVSFSTPENAKGGDASEVVKYALNKYRKIAKNTQHVTHIVVMLDSDKGWEKAEKIVNKHNEKKKPPIEIILSVPCFENFLAKLLGQSMPEHFTSEQKKRHIEMLYGYLPQHIEWDKSSITHDVVLAQSEFECIAALMRDAS